MNYRVEDHRPSDIWRGLCSVVMFFPCIIRVLGSWMVFETTSNIIVYFGVLDD